MRWRLNPPEYGDTRIQWKFLWFPRRAKDQNGMSCWRWLEYAYVKEEYDGLGWFITTWMDYPSDKNTVNTLTKSIKEEQP